MEELERLSITDFHESEKQETVIVLDNIRSQSNTGSIFRTSDAYRLQKIYLCGITATPPHREIQKTALGATESVAWEYYESTLDCIQNLKKAGYKILCIEQTRQSIPLDNYVFNKGEKNAIVLGNELNGVSDDVIAVSDECIELPQFGTKHSLNVSVCAGIVIWESSKPYFSL